MGSQPTKTSSSSASYSRSLKEGLDSLRDEIQLAFSWHRPSILLAVSGTKSSLNKAQLALEKELAQSGQKVTGINPTDRSPDVIKAMCSMPNRGQVVFFVSGIGSANESLSRKAYSALNMHRELLVEHQIRVVFWLTKSEAASLPHYAPDFWAFRHRVVEFNARLGASNK
jgi:hypothetical protein